MAKAKSSNAVGVIGLGSMGLGVAHTLLGKGFTVYAYDVRPQVLRDFARKGGKACASPAEVGAKAPVVIVLVVNADQTAEVLFGRNGAAARMARGSVVIASATVAPAVAEADRRAPQGDGHPHDRRAGERRRRAGRQRAAVDHGLGRARSVHAGRGGAGCDRRQGLPPGRCARAWDRRSR